MSRIMIAGTSSGVGKTSIVCGILDALKKMDNKVISFKCGPDYIDPMFHKKITGVPSKNLDIFLMGEDSVKNTLRTSEQSYDISVIEGVMGLYDGLGATSKYSANNISVLTKTPTILVVNPKGKAISVCAEIKGYLSFEQNNIKAIVLNNIKESMYLFYKNMIEKELSICVIGFLPYIENAVIESRHLGLMNANEVYDIKEKVDLLGNYVIKNFDIDKIVDIARDTKPLVYENYNTLEKMGNPIIYIALDEAFNFIYDDNLNILKQLGATIKYFSPMYDNKLPDDADGIMLFGGYPEIYAEILDKNISMKNSLINKISNGLIVYAECGGFIYLQESIIDKHGKLHYMLGVLDGKVSLTSNLQNFGYTALETTKSNKFLNTEINAHSFHYSKSTNTGNCFLATKVSNQKKYNAGVITDNIFASYFHIHFLNNLELPKNIIKLCTNYKVKR